MNYSYELILTIGIILLLGIFADSVGKRTHLPRVTLLILFGIVIGVNGLDFVPVILVDNYDLIADVALTMIGFLVGGKLTKTLIIKHGTEVLIITISVVLATTLIVSIGLHISGTALHIAIILGCIASATAPAATLDVIMETNKNSLFSDRLVAIVALDDLVGLVLFSLCLSILSSGIQGFDNLLFPVYSATKDIIGAVILGILIGFPASYLTGQAKPGQPLLIEALGLILICGGLAMYFSVSHLISAIVMGIVVTNNAKHHEYSFHEIENIEWPFMIVFFTLAGASINLMSIIYVIPTLLLYIVFRVAGKVFGAYLGGKLSSVDQMTSKWMGVALLPQAGVAIGMVLVASHYYPEHQNFMLTMIVAATIVFELIGPIFTRLAIQKVSI